MGNISALTRRIARPGLVVAALLLASCAGRHPEPPGAGAASPPPASVDKSTPTPNPAERDLPPDPIREDAALVYTVQRGDTLWDIASYFLEDPWLWPEIWIENPDIPNPHLIFPGDVISLSYVAGRPRLQVVERTVRLSPEVRTESLADAVPTIPVGAVKDFLRGPRVVDQDALKTAPYIVAFASDRLLAADGIQVYVRNWQAGEDPLRMSVLHPGRAYRDPDTDELLGFEVIHVADAVIEQKSAPAVGLLYNSSRETQIGDRLLPREDNTLDPYFTPKAPDKPMEGYIIAVFDGVSQIAEYQIVTLDLGLRDGIGRGDLLAVTQAGRVVDDPYTDEQVRLPEQKAGLVMVFDVYDRLSYALVMETDRAIHVMDKVRTPISAD